MIKLNCKIRSMQNWKAPDRISILFRKGNKHRQVQNPPKISWGTVLFTKKEASHAELSDHLSLSPSTGSVVCSCRGFRGHGDPSSLHGPLRWGFACLCPGAVSRGGPVRRGSGAGVCHPAKVNPSHVDREQFLSMTDRPLSSKPSPPGPRAVDSSFLFPMCFTAQMS